MGAGGCTVTKIEIDAAIDFVEACLTAANPAWCSKFITETAGLVFHYAENMIQIETKRLWSTEMETAVEDSIRDACSDYESEVYFTLVEKRGNTIWAPKDPRK